MAYLELFGTLYLFVLIVPFCKCIEPYSNELYTRNVLEHRTVRVQTLSKHCNNDSIDSDCFVQFVIDGKIYNLKLTVCRRSAFTFTTPVWIASSVSNQNKKYIYKMIDQKDTFFGGFFVQDEEHMATLLVKINKRRRQIVYSGIFGRGTEIQVIRSVAEMLKVKQKSTAHYSEVFYNKIYNFTNKDQRNEQLQSRLLAFKDSADTDKLKYSELHIKIVTVIDYDLFKLLRKDVQETLKYIAIFWNTVDMEFRKLTAEMNDSKIEFAVTGVVIATDEHALYFINNSRDKIDSNKVHTYVLLEEARWHFYNNFVNDTGLTNYDAIFVMTGLNMKPSAGMSYIGRICNRLYSTAVIQDDANFLGLHAAAHEIGHLLNLFHDGSDDAKDCKPFSKDGESTIMAPYIRRTKAFVWSKCSKSNFKDFIKTKAAKCLHESFRKK